jgi:hypothetical protein
VCGATLEAQAPGDGRSTAPLELLAEQVRLLSDPVQYGDHQPRRWVISHVADKQRRTFNPAVGLKPSADRCLGQEGALLTADDPVSP